MPQTCVFLAKANTSGSTPKCSKRPPLAGRAEAGLHLVEDEQELVFVGELAQLLEELGAEVVVAAFALDRLDDESRDVVSVLRHRGLDLGHGLALERHCRLETLRRRREAQHRIQDPRPGELGKVLGLARIGGVGERQGVAAAAVECLAKVEDLRTDLAPPGGEVLAHLPVEGHLERILDRQRAAFDEEEVLAKGLGDGAREGLHELGHEGGVDVGVRRLVERRGEDPLGELRGGELGMIEAQGRGREVAEEIEHVAPADGVVQEDAVALLDVLDHMVAVDQDVARENLAHRFGGQANGVVDGRLHRRPRVDLASGSH